MKDISMIREFIESRRASEKLVLCTLVRKTGSSYRAVGAKKVVSLNGESSGLLSGGCLEASIEKIARENYNQLPLKRTFDMLSDDDRLLGYQTGCQGAIDILFEQIGSETDLDLLLPFDPIELVVIGCGADAKSYVSFAEALGWKIQFLDYRRDLVEGGDFPEGTATHAQLMQLSARVPQGPRVAAVLMTHNYESDLEILKGLREHNLGYLGCLGPAQRFERLQKDLLSLYGLTLTPKFLGRAFAPAGILTNGRSPEEIALSVVTQIQQQLVENIPSKVWTVILAAGESKRFGSPKALATFRGQTLIERAIKSAREFGGENVLVVTGAHHQKMLDSLIGVRHTFNPMFADGLATSIAHGLHEMLNLDSSVTGVTLLPVDQPLVDAEHLRTLWREGTRAGRCALTASEDAFGPPAYIPKSYFYLARKIQGDRGLKSVLKPSQTILVEAPQAFRDADTPAAIQELSL